MSSEKTQKPGSRISTQFMFGEVQSAFCGLDSPQTQKDNIKGKFIINLVRIGGSQFVEVGISFWAAKI